VRIPLSLVPSIVNTLLDDIDMAAVDMNNKDITVDMLRQYHPKMEMPASKSHPDLSGS